MGTLQINVQNPEQWKALLDFLRKMKLDFRVLEGNETWADQDADADPHDSYKASKMALEEDWNHPNNDHWDKY
jgi:hypothetical protein